MARRRYHFDAQFLTLSFFVFMPLVTFGAFLLVSVAKGKLQSSVGQSLEQQALETKIVLERYIGERIVHLRLLSQDALVVSSLLSPNTSLSRQQSRLIDRAWRTGRPSSVTAPFLTTPLAVRLRETTGLLPTLRLLQVVGSDGRIVASSTRGGRLSLNDRPWFIAMSHEDLVGAYVGELPSATNAPGYLEVAYPVFHPQSSAWIGAVCGFMSAVDLYAVLAPVRIGQTGRALLLRSSDGLILASDETERVLRDTFSGFSSIRTGMQARQGYWIIPRHTEWSRAAGASLTAPPRLVGFTLVDQIPGVRWIVAVEQSLDEATAPVRDVTLYLWLHFLGAAAAIILLSVFLSLRQERPIIEEALHLHEDHVPPSMQRRQSDTNQSETPPPAA